MNRDQHDSRVLIQESIDTTSLIIQQFPIFFFPKRASFWVFIVNFLYPLSIFITDILTAHNELSLPPLQLLISSSNIFTSTLCLPKWILVNCRKARHSRVDLRHWFIAIDQIMQLQEDINKTVSNFQQKYVRQPPDTMTCLNQGF